VGSLMPPKPKARKPAPARCRHPRDNRHYSDYNSDVGGYLTSWCDICGSSWSASGWQGQRSKWRLPANALLAAKKGKRP
jgi:hypothetical protein